MKFMGNLSPPLSLKTSKWLVPCYVLYLFIERNIFYIFKGVIVLLLFIIHKLKMHSYNFCCKFSCNFGCNFICLFLDLYNLCILKSKHKVYPTLVNFILPLFLKIVALYQTKLFSDNLSRFTQEQVISKTINTTHCYPLYDLCSFVFH